VTGVQRFHSRFVNWYLVEDGDRLAAIDAGLPPDWSALCRTLARRGQSIGQLAAVVLTHAHVDHLGFAERARREAGATIYVHERDAPLASSRRRVAAHERNPLRYARYAQGRASMAAMLRTAAFRGKPVRDLTTFADGDTLTSVAGSPRVVFTPGHTLGHCALHLPDRDVLFTGDALVTCNPYTGRLGPQIVARAATADSDAALASLERIAATGARTLLPGHGEPWIDGAGEAVRLARTAGSS
jgi:glyoxylase-like metal-dependent hydrolase (beta-lactamase superfamily II)